MTPADKCHRCNGTGRAPWIFAGREVDRVRCGQCQGSGKAEQSKGKAKNKATGRTAP